MARREVIIVTGMKDLFFIILVGCFFLLHVVTGIYDNYCSWGVHFLLFYPRWVLVFVALCGTAIMIPQCRRGMLSISSKLISTFDLWASALKLDIRRLVLLVILCFSFIGFSSAIHLLGDGYLYLRELPLGFETKVWRIGHEPASLRLVGMIYQAGQIWDLSPEFANRFFSYFSGLLYLLLIYPITRILGQNQGERTLIWGFLLSAGYIQFFYGYVETYPILTPAVLLYLLVGMQVIRRRCAFWVPVMVLGLTIPLHFTMVVILPSLIVLGYQRYRECSWVYRTAISLIALVVVSLIVASILLIQGINPLDYLAGVRANHFLSLWSEPDAYQPYKLFTWSHLLDIINQLLLVAPAAILSLPLIIGRLGKNRSDHLFLLSAFAFPLLFVWLVNPEVGAFRDWDVLALPALPLTLWAAMALVERLSGRPQFAHASLMICFAAAMHTVLWVGINARAGAAESRFVYNVENCVLSKHARAYGWETLGGYYDQEKNDVESALQAFEMAIAADEWNPRYWNLAGVKYAELGNYEKAIYYLENAVTKQHDTNPKHLNNLAFVYSEVGRHEMAIQCLQQAVSLQPEFAEGFHNLGLALAKTGQLEAAVDAWRRAVTLEPKNHIFLKNLGIALSELHRYTKAIHYLSEALAVDHEDTDTAIRLGQIYLKSGNEEKAVHLWQTMLSRKPDAVDLHVHLGFALGMIGQLEQSKTHLEKVLELQPNHPQAKAVRQMLKVISQRSP